MNIKGISNTTKFNYFMMAIIILNAALIGFQTSFDNLIIDRIQISILYIFVFEIIIRWIGRKTLKEYFSNPWNWFDLFIVGISLVPNSFIEDAEIISVFRVIRVFRLLRLFKAFPELQNMIKVLFKGALSLSYATVLMFIFMYIYAIIGVILFKGESTVVTAHCSTLDPFVNIWEACFSLFRVTTGEDWTDLRYDLLQGKNSILVINLYYISWYIISAFLLVNIVFGAIISHYEEFMQKTEGDSNDDIMKKLKEIEDKIAKL